MTRRLRILLAEDEFLIAITLRAQLESFGYEVIATPQTGRQAVEQTRELKPDVVLMDIGMPELDGISATEQIMAESPTPVIMLTAYGDRQRVQSALAAGARAYVLKPVIEAQLRSAIESAVATS
jgi:CheY-like chemotaxis protein